MPMDLATQQEMIENLTKLLEANTAQLQYRAQNSDAFFLIVMAVIIYCKDTYIYLPWENGNFKNCLMLIRISLKHSSLPRYQR